jgi:hypothetical protein
MKEGIRSLFVYSLILFFVFSFFSESLILPESVSYLILTILILSFTVMIACPVLNFLTIKCNFPTFFLMTTLLLVGIIYLLKLFMVGFYIKSYTFAGLDMGELQISEFEVTPIISILFFSVFSSFLCSIYKALDSSK